MFGNHLTEHLLHTCKEQTKVTLFFPIEGSSLFALSSFLDSVFGQWNWIFKFSVCIYLTQHSIDKTGCFFEILNTYWVNEEINKWGDGETQRIMESPPTEKVFLVQKLCHKSRVKKNWNYKTDKVPLLKMWQFFRYWHNI